jgi:hypothetical protein
MSFTGSTLYIAITSFQYANGGVNYNIVEGQAYLGSKLTGAPEGLFVAFGSTDAEIVAAKRAAGLTG